MAENEEPLAPDVPEEETPKTLVADLKFSHMVLIIVAGIFATTLPQPQLLGKLPLQNLLKNHLHVKPSEMADFFFWCGLAWYFKPFAGILTDAFPLFKTRRRWYLLISCVLATLSWVALGLVPRTYQSLLWASIVVNFFMVIMSTVTGAFLVEAGQRLGATGRLTSVRQIVSNACGFINGPLSGFLAGGLFLTASGVNAALVFSVFPIAWIFLKERPLLARNTHALHNAKEQLKIIGRSSKMWWAILFIGLFYFAPGFSTLLYYRQNDVLKFDQQFIGNLQAFSGAAGITAAVLYSFLIRRLSIKGIILTSIACAALGTLFYLKYDGALSAILIESQNGFFFGLAEVALIDLAARATPAGCEGLGYSLILSMRNLALFGADKLGTQMQEEYKWPFSTMVFINAITTGIVLILVPLLPKALTSSKDKPRE
jgi:MFS family permease